MHNSTKKLDEKEIKGFIVRLWCKEQFNQKSLGGIEKSFWVSAKKNGQTFRSSTISISNHTDQNKDQLHKEADRVEDIEIISEMKVQIRLQGSSCDYWINAIL